MSTYFCFPPRPRVGVPRPLPPRLDPPLPSPGNPPLSSITENDNFKIEQQNRRLNLHITQKSTNSSTHSTFQWNLHCLLAPGGVLQTGQTSCQWMTITENYDVWNSKSAGSVLDSCGIIYIQEWQIVKLTTLLWQVYWSDDFIK